MDLDPPVARTSGIDAARLDLFFLETFALTVALGLRYLGVLLMGSLIFIPATTARRIAGTLTRMLVSAVVIAVLTTLIGTYVAQRLHRPTGPVIITVASCCFLLSLLWRRD